MDEIARQIGWWVIVIGVVYVLGKLVLSVAEVRDAKSNSILHASDIVLRLAYRKILRSTTDEAIHAEVNRHYPTRFILYVDLDDEQYQRRVVADGAGPELTSALAHVAKHGDHCRVVDGRLTYRPSDGWVTLDA